MKALKENEQGRKTEDICREMGIHKGTFYNWRKKYSGMGQPIEAIKRA
ncbi:transposase [Roseivirga sp. UBA838]